MRACTRLLRRGGILFLYVPNYDSASRLLMGKDAHFIWPTHHLNYYTPATIRDLLAREGLTTDFLATEGLDFVDYLWYRREVHGRDDAGVEEIADLQVRRRFLGNAEAMAQFAQLKKGTSPLIDWTAPPATVSQERPMPVQPPPPPMSDASRFCPPVQPAGGTPDREILAQDL